jgi:ERCC4-related helicase
VQRNGRTGRRRPGRVVQLYLSGEESKMEKAKATQRAIKKAMERLTGYLIYQNFPFFCCC